MGTWRHCPCTHCQGIDARLVCARRHLEPLFLFYLCQLFCSATTCWAASAPLLGPLPDGRLALSGRGLALSGGGLAFDTNEPRIWTRLTQGHCDSHQLAVRVSDRRTFMKAPMANLVKMVARALAAAPQLVFFLAGTTRHHTH